MAAYIDEKLDATTNSRVRNHLVKCNHCFKIYHQSVRVLGARSARRTDEPVNQEWIREAMDLASPQTSSVVPRKTKRDWRAFLRVWRTQLVSVAAVLVIAIVVSEVVKPGKTTDTFDPLSPAVYPISLVMIEASGQRALILPGIEIESARSGSILRSGPIKPDASFDDAMSTLIESYRSGSLSDHGVRWIVGGYLATGQYEHARSFIEDVRPESRDDADFEVLESILLYGENDLNRAALCLQSAIEHDHDHWVAHFNLAYILIQQDRASASLPHLEMIVTNAPDAALVDRAQQLLDKLDVKQRPVSNG